MPARWRAPVTAMLLVALIVTPLPGRAQSPSSHQRDSWFSADKVKHFFMSAFIESVTFSGLQVAGASRNAAFGGAVGATAVFAIGKEIHDRKTKGLFSIRDVAWDAAGAGSAGLMLRKTQR